MKTVSGSTRIPTLCPHVFRPRYGINERESRANTRTILIDAYRGGLISLLAPYDFDDYDIPTDIPHRIGRMESWTATLTRNFSY